MQYDNTSYWKEMHKELKGSLQAVGISALSQEYNKLKYLSESNSLYSILEKIKSNFVKTESVNILDIGAGIGYWSNLIFKFYETEKKNPSVTALDISKDALDSINQNFPNIKTIQIDLKEVELDLVKDKFDLVTSFYCFHHIVSLKDYSNAIKFAGRSVKKDGYLIIGDPILSKPYSKFYNVDFPTFKIHSFPRPLYLIDDILMDEGFERIEQKNAVSFLLNGNVESRSKLGYFIQRKLWNLGYYYFYRSNKFVKLFSPLIKFIDETFKKGKASNSSVFILYKKK